MSALSPVATVVQVIAWAPTKNFLRGGKQVEFTLSVSKSGQNSDFGGFSGQNSNILEVFKPFVSSGTNELSVVKSSKTGLLKCHPG